VTANRNDCKIGSTVHCHNFIAASIIDLVLQPNQMAISDRRYGIIGKSHIKKQSGRQCFAFCKLSSRL